MEFDTNQGGDGGGKRFFTGEWTCSKCGAKITTLPFEPDPNRLNQLLCRDCHRARNQSFRR